ncbi:MAG TPA: flagellar biosynthesis protein [Rhodanobacter sp.]|jgi:flagellar biosynthesis protein|nr:flagellar biosynthesis protein [Rhodanobacter sp.]
MNTPLPPPHRKVSLRLGNSVSETRAMPPESLENLLARARTLGLPVHHDPQIAALLAALRMRDDVPTLLYASAASVLAAVYDAAEE